MNIVDDAKKIYGKEIPGISGFYNIIQSWANIFQNNTLWSRVKKGGLYGGERMMNKLGTAKVLSDEFSHLTFSEQVSISVNEKYNDYVQDVLRKNGFWKRMPSFLSFCYAMGGGVLKVYAEDGKPCINYVNAELFVPVSWTEKEITEGVFESKIYKNGFHYTLFEKYTVNQKKNIAVECKLFKSSRSTSIGKECPVSELYPDMLENFEYQTTEPMFRYFAPENSNNVDWYVPLGASVFSNAIDTLKALDVAFDSFEREFSLGKKRIIVPSKCIRTVVDPESGEMRKYFDADDEAFVALKSEDTTDLKIVDNTVELRIEEHVMAINALLNILCFQTGLSAGALSFDAAQGLKTATEVISADSKTARTTNANKNLVVELIEGLVRSIIALGIALGDIPTSKDDDYGITVQMPDTVIVDDNTKMQNIINLVTAGLMSKLAAIMELKGCDEATAKKELAQIAKEQNITGDISDEIILADNESLNTEGAE